MLLLPDVTMPQGSDPRVATCRGKLQNRRCQLNQEINKEMRLRAGAENLFKATHNRKLRETVALELSFVNSNLQLLKEQLASLNSSVELYQNDSKDSVMPMIPLGLKETKEVDFREPFTDFILEHYSEEATTYQDAISDFMDMRQAIRTPVRHASGVALLFRYYNQLYFIERRFFPPDRSLGIYFEWFDSLTGVPSCQRTVAFEKACILFNMAAIYTQIGAKQDRSESKGLDSAVDSLLRAAGMFRYIHENFTNAPSMDLGPDMLDMLVNLMLAQARECLFEKLILGAEEECAAREKELCDDLPLCLDLCQESQTLAQQYEMLGQKMQAETVLNYVPYSWVSLVNIKTEFYKALAHHHIATGLLNATSTRTSVNSKTQERISSVHSSEPNLPDWCEYTSTKNDRNVDPSLIKNNSSNGSLVSQEEQRIALGKAHLSEALSSYEEALRLQRMCRELKAKASICRVLRQRHEKALNESALLPDGPDFGEVLESPKIMPSTKFQLSLTQPDFAQHRVEDLFKSLGPVAIFSAKRHWSAPRTIQLQKSNYNLKSSRNERIPGKDSKRVDRGRVNGKLYTNEDSIQRNGQKVFRNGSLYEKRDRSEDNSAYYYQRDIIRSDDKYRLQREDSTKLDYNELKKKVISNNNVNKPPVTRQNGIYINGYNNNLEKKSSFSKPYDDAYYNEKNASTNDLRINVKTDGNNRIRIKNDAIQIGNGKSAYFQKSLGAENFGYIIDSRQQNSDDKNGDANHLRRISSECNISPADEKIDENGHERNPSDGFGFSVRGDAPVIIAGVELRSLADLGGMREGDFIVAIGDRDVKWSPHDEVVKLIKASGDTLSLKLVTPMDRNYLKASNSPSTQNSGSNQGSVSAASTASSNGSTGGVSRSHMGARRLPSWNPFKRHNVSRDSSSNRGSHSSNVIFR
ncbi:GTP-Rho-binding protein rhophilin isoform X2 [Arctopsyche grandis]|uniref:GTP-Rho-binding protein rhophilin isoform X2 n=1 Tax=Arctopsyche grandis TaxID=121162 RepID=UPI00406D8174